MPSVYITSKIPDDLKSTLLAHGFKVEENLEPRNLSTEELRKIFKEYDAVVTLVTDKIDKDVISSSKNIKIIANYGVGFDNIDLAAAKNKGIIVANTPGVANESVAEHTFALILACAKNIIETDKFTRGGKYTRWDPMAFVAPQIWGTTIGIVGLGKIGTFVAQIAFGGFRMKILYSDMQRSEDFELLYEAKFCKFEELLTQADIVTLHVPLTPETRYLIGKDELLLMKNSATLINTSRGPVVDEQALIWALSLGQIKAAGLDVFENEYSISEELRNLPNVVLTPHIASATLETRTSMTKISAENIISVFEGKKPPGGVNVD